MSRTAAPPWPSITCPQLWDSIGKETNMKRNKITQHDPFGREQSTFEEKEDDDGSGPFDSRTGLLKDGRSVHIGMMVRDGDGLRLPTFPASSPFAWRNEMHQHFVAQDAARRSGTDASAVLVTDGSDDSWALHRPGPRYLADLNARNAATAELEKAYAEYDADQSDRWRGNNKLVCLADRKTGSTPGMDAREAAYAAYDKEMSDAWRKTR
jgi:hypothetical protein